MYRQDFHRCAAYIDESARIFGDVRLSEDCSVWPFAVLRSERNHISVGRAASIQDHAMVHVGWDRSSIIGDYCTIGHRATIHGCTIGPACLVGIGATIMDGCLIGHGSVIAGHAFVPPNTRIPPGSMVVGTPAKVVRPFAGVAENILGALLYLNNARGYAQGEYRCWQDFDDTELRARAAQIAEDAGPTWLEQDHLSFGQYDRDTNQGS